MVWPAEGRLTTDVPKPQLQWGFFVGKKLSGRQSLRNRSQLSSNQTACVGYSFEHVCLHGALKMEVSLQSIESGSSTMASSPSHSRSPEPIVNVAIFIQNSDTLQVSVPVTRSRRPNQFLPSEINIRRSIAGPWACLRLSHVKLSVFQSSLQPEGPRAASSVPTS